MKSAMNSVNFELKNPIDQQRHLLVIIVIMIGLKLIIQKLIHLWTKQDIL